MMKQRIESMFLILDLVFFFHRDTHDITDTYMYQSAKCYFKREFGDVLNKDSE